MDADLKQLNELLSLIDQHIDLEHCRQVDDRYRRWLTCGPSDRPPLVVQAPFAERLPLPAPWDRFAHYPYRQAFRDPTAMMQNQLLNRVVPGLLLRDDNPLAIRNDHGTIQIASAFGAKWDQHEDNHPWVEPLHAGQREIDRIIEKGVSFDPGCGVLPYTTRTLKFYREQLDQYPTCCQAIQVSLPDLQGPMDTAEQLLGSEVMLALIERPDWAAQLMRRIVAMMRQAMDYLRPLTRERSKLPGITQHGYVIPGNLLIRDDSSILVAPNTYREVIGLVDGELLQAIGGGSLHFCGNGQHLVEPMLELAALRGLDLGQADMMDLPWVYDRCRNQNIVITNIQPPRESLMNGSARERYPTGVAMVYLTQDIEDAREVVRAYQQQTVTHHR